MSVNRQAARRDKNEAEIIRALESVGATVERLSAKGVPDLLVGWWDCDISQPRNILMEVKVKGNGLTPDQVQWHNNWQGAVAIVYTVKDALEAIGVEADV